MEMSYYASFVGHIVLPSPVGHGWMIKNDVLTTHIFDGPTSAEVIEGLVCNCRRTKSTCKENNYSCFEMHLSYIDLCGCEADDCCKNTFNIATESSESSESSTDEKSDNEL